ncbi:MAG: hypothetical protein HN900_05220 [Gammaproteobacteria bacterium]|jgi:hypothetical protein|nr:hypothetical protein [Pseudomonadota bacterium]MBT5981611.1 hypothetical protein [Acidiferrobacteraceae bacterium]MBT7174063.1 hypothetical protein [Gammaproteobacteria bacterium]
MAGLMDQASSICPHSNGISNDRDGKAQKFLMREKMVSEFDLEGTSTA